MGDWDCSKRATKLFFCCRCCAWVPCITPLAVISPPASQFRACAWLPAGVAAGSSVKEPKWLLLWPASSASSLRKPCEAACSL